MWVQWCSFPDICMCLIDRHTPCLTNKMRQLAAVYSRMCVWRFHTFYICSHFLSARQLFIWLFLCWWWVPTSVIDCTYQSVWCQLHALTEIDIIMDIARDKTHGLICSCVCLSLPSICFIYVFYVFIFVCFYSYRCWCSLHWGEHRHNEDYNQGLRN